MEEGHDFFSIVSSDPFVKVKRNQLRGNGCPKSAPLQGTIQGKDDDLYCAIYCLQLNQSSCDVISSLHRILAFLCFTVKNMGE